MARAIRNQKVSLQSARYDKINFSCDEMLLSKMGRKLLCDVPSSVLTQWLVCKVNVPVSVLSDKKLLSKVPHKLPCDIHWRAHPKPQSLGEARQHTPLNINVSIAQLSSVGFRRGGS